MAGGGGGGMSENGVEIIGRGGFSLVFKATRSTTSSSSSVTLSEGNFGTNGSKMLNPRNGDFKGYREFKGQSQETMLKPLDEDMVAVKVINVVADEDVVLDRRKIKGKEKKVASHNSFLKLKIPFLRKTRAFRFGKRRKKNQVEDNTESLPTSKYSDQIETLSNIVEETERLMRSPVLKSEVEKEEMLWRKACENSDFIITFIGSSTLEGKYLFELEFAERGDVLEFLHQYGTILDSNVFDESKASCMGQSFGKENDGIKFNLLKLIFSGVLCGLKQLEQLGIIHRDIKPDNILITHDFIPKIGDFGISTEDTTMACSPSSKKKSGFIGTEVYAPPEAFYPYGFNSSWDSFSFCLSILTCFFGHSAWHHGSPKVSSISDLFLSCNDFIAAGKSTEDAEETYYLTLCRVIKPNPKSFKSKGEQFLFDPIPWTKEREDFEHFAREGMKMDINCRSKPSDLANHEYMKQYCVNWETNKVKAAECLRKAYFKLP